MLALRYRKSVPRYLLMRAGAKRIKNLETSRFSPLRLEEIPDPEPPSPEWVRVHPLLSGICGSDLGTLSSENSPYFSPITSPPFVLGHELVGVVAEDNGDLRAGERVVLEPALGCAARGIDPPCPYCASGRHNLCLNVAKGTLAPGIQTGFCRDTGGGWSEGTLVAHPSQLHRVPENVSDEAAVAIEPLACAVHAALKADPKEDETALVIGAGSVGLFVVAALRRLTRPGGDATLVGMPCARSRLDLSALWFKEVNLAGAYAYGVEEYDGERVRSFELALRIAQEIELEALVGPRFRLREYREAIAAARASGGEGHVKVVFDH